MLKLKHRCYFKNYQTTPDSRINKMLGTNVHQLYLQS